MQQIVQDSPAQNLLEALRFLIYEPSPDNLNTIADILEDAPQGARDYALWHLEDAASVYPEAALWRVVLVADRLVDGDVVRGALWDSQAWEGGRRRDLYGAALKRLDAAPLFGLRAHAAELNYASLICVDLRRAWLPHAHLEHANLYGANLQGADLAAARMNFALLRKADLRRAHLGEARLTNADLTRADLRGANLCGADLTYADLGNTEANRTRLAGALWDRRTRWPAFFDTDRCCPAGPVLP